MAGIKIPIGGDLGPLREAIEKIRGHFRRLSSHIATALRPLRAIASSVFDGMARAARAAARSIRNVFAGLRNAVGLGGLIGGAGAGLLAAGALKGGSDLAADFERTHMALTAVTGSATEATRVLETMKATWAATGVEVADQARTIQKFIALGFSPDDALQLQANILDIAGAVGMTASEAELLGSALAQVKAKGVVSMEELRQQIAEKGVPVFEALANRLGVTQAQLMKLVEDGKVPAQELLAIFQNMEGSFAKFRGGAAALGSTFGGMVARLKAAWGLLMADLVAPINDALKPVLTQGIAFLDSLRERAREVGRTLGNGLLAAFSIIRRGQTMSLMAAGLRVAVAGAVDMLSRGFRGVIAFLVNALPPVVDAAFAKLQDPTFWLGIMEIFKGLGRMIASEMLEAMGRTEAAAHKRASADLAFDIGRRGVDSAGGVDFAAVLEKSLTDGGKAFAAQVTGPAGKNLREAIEALRVLLRGEAAAVERLRRGIPNPAPGTAGAARGGSQGNAELFGTKMAGVITFLGTSLSRVGLGGGGMALNLSPMISQQQTTNEHLKAIRNKITEGGGRAAVFA